MRFSTSVYEEAERRVQEAFASRWHNAMWAGESDVWADEAHLATQVILDYIMRLTGGVQDASALES